MRPAGAGFSSAWEGLPKNVKVVGVAGVLIVAGFVGALYLMAPDGDAGDADMATSAVAADSAGGRLLFGVDDVALGRTATTNGQESTRWAGLWRTEGRADLVPGTMTSIASGPVDVDPITDARFTFRSAAYVKDGILHELIIPQDTLRLRIPGEPGHPGDTLFVTFDVGRSIADEAGRLTFRPFVSEARWIRSPAASGDAAAADPALAGDLSSPTVVPEGQVYESPSGTQAPGGTNNGNQQNQPQAQVGRATFFVRDEAALAVESLDIDFAKLGLGSRDGQSISTYYEGSKRIDVRKYAGPEDRAFLVSFQLPAGDYKDIYLEFATSEATIAQSRSTLTVPQPTLVLERNFTVEVDRTLEFLVDFSVQESINPSGDGWELRPVVGQLQASDQDTDADGIVDPRDPDDDNDGVPDNEDVDRDGDGVPDKKPAQYRKGGNVMPSVGQTNSYYVQSTTGRDVDATTNNAGEAATGGESRPADSEGGVDLDDPLGNAEDLLKDPGVVIQTSNGQHLYILQALSRNLIPSTQTLAPLGAQEIKRLDNLPVILVAGPPGIAPDLRALPGVIHVEEDVATAPFP